MTRPRLPWLLAALGGALGVYAAVIAVQATDALTLPAPVHLAIGWSFVGAGTVAWLRRPANRTGLLMTLAGLMWFGRDFDWIDSAVTRHVDGLATNLFVALVAHLLVVFPEGRPRGRTERVLVIAIYLLATLGYVVSELGSAANVAVDVLAIAVASAVLVRLVHRWLTASPPARRALAPVLWTGPAVLAVVFLMLALDSGDSWPAWVDATVHWAALVFIALPLAFLAGLLRERLHRGVVADLLVDLSAHTSPADVQAALARALGDPSLEVAYWLPDDNQYVDVHGRPVHPSSSERAVTVLERDDGRIAALIHDPSLLAESNLIEAAGAAAGLALENARLHAELRAQLAEVRASRARIVSAGDAERRRIERNLHDGAQQRLLGIRLSLRVARGRLDGSAESADPLLADAEAELAGTLDDLRALARGIHPIVLAEEGLAPALETLARRSVVPVTIAAAPAQRLPESVEAAAYYVTAEALANVTKHAHATCVTLAVRTVADRLVVDVTDDGVGGARAALPGGLVGLQDRVAAVDGTLQITSPQGGGTHVHAEIPLTR